MDLDTKWTKFKYSNFNKLLCVILACFMLAQVVLNVIPAINYVYVFEGNSFNSKDKTIYNFHRLWECVNSDINHVLEEADYNYQHKKAIEHKDKILNEVVSKYLSESQEKGFTYQEALNTYGESFEDNHYYLGKNNLIYFEDYFEYDIENVDSKIIQFSAEYYGEDEKSIRNIFEQQFWSYVNDDYKNEDNPYLSANLEIKNMDYYVEHIDGTVVTNVEDKNSIISNVDGKDYVIFENSKIKFSENLTDNIIHSVNENSTENIACAYFSIDTTFKGNDRCAYLYGNYLAAKDVDFNASLIKTVLFSIVAIAFLICSIRLAGRKNREVVEKAWIDKLPNDIHLILSVAAGGGLGFACPVLSLNLIPYRTLDKTYSMWINICVVLLALATYLVVLEYLTSLARKIKSNENIFKNTFIYKFTKAFVKFSKKVWAKIKVISKKTNNKLKTYFETLSFMPKELNKKAIVYSILIVLLNVFLSLIGCAFIFATTGGVIMMGLIVLLGLFIIDGYIINKVANYLKYLDMIITASKTGNALNVDVNLLPNSLKTLAEGLEKTNAELDMAIRKAVKDERTKTELITNVSHDLKTPLTSVINYIDLLKKCDIKDETAKKYMDVIDEKSIKLKRLIEDLIEASKVTTGNVTLNKTMINIYELAMQAVVEETSDIEKAGLNIIFEETTERSIVFADGTKIYRVFENLLSNARKYSAPYSRIYARVYSDNEFGYFEIKNISKEPLNITAEELTERFVRGDKSRNQEGNGLGLSIAKELCRLNGGELLITIDGDLFKATVKLPKSDDNR